MAKKGTFNGPFFNSFAARIHGTPIRFGLLVGTEAEDDRLRDLVFAAPTPPRPGEDGEPTPPPKDIVALAKSKGSADFAAWARQHADALRKLLPGGLEPCGCFAVAPEADAKDLAPMLVTLLKGVSEPLVMTVDERTRKQSFWQLSGGAKPAMRPAQMKADPHKEALLLWTSTSVDVLVPQPTPREDDAADAAADALVRDVEKGVGEALASCSVGVEAAEGAPLCLVDFGSEAAVSTAVPKDCQEMRVAFLRSGSGPVSVPNPEGRPCMRQRCLLVGAAVVLRRTAELRHAVSTLRKALAACAGQRLQLALDEAEGGAKGRLQLPWRALCRPEGVDLPFWCGDYCMPDEDLGAARERLGQLLGVGESSFEAAPEHLDERAQFGRDHRGTYGPPEPEEPPAGAKKPGGGLLLPAAGCAVAVAAVLLAVLVPMVLQS
uniref:Uncharacterized protein n=1 Tax=Alexandrium monilatum TaxID=311494 RepID=A0A7S4S4H2_9DINO